MQIVHKLLLDLLNTALHQEALSLHRARVPRVGGEVSAISGGAGAATGVGGGLGASGVLGASGGNVSGVSRGALPWAPTMRCPTRKPSCSEWWTRQCSRCCAACPGQCF